jgi:tubulin polyglutamylase TTLL5
MNLRIKRNKTPETTTKNGISSPTSTSVNTSSSTVAVNVNNSYGNKNAVKPSAVKAYQEFIFFKTIKEHQVCSGPLSSHLYTRGGSNDYAELTFKLLKCESRLVRSTLEAVGFTYTESHDWNLLWIAASGKPYLYDGLNEYQKINHYPNSYEITRKDKLCLNVLKMQEKFGKRNFHIIPDTYLLPDEFADFFAEFHQLKNSEGRKPLWIIKPNASSQGKGIYLIDDINEIDLDESMVVSKYVPNPLLINGHKFDLRIYVLVTSFDPFRVYVYKEGLTRFATEEYTTATNKKSRYIHLTNYSLNKKNANWKTNEDADRDDYGFKWSVTALCKHLEQIGIDMNLLWSKCYDIILKALI